MSTSGGNSVKESHFISNDISNSDRIELTSEDGTTKEYKGLDIYNSEIKKLARTVSSSGDNNAEGLASCLSSMSHVPGISPYHGNIKPSLDPNSDEFNAKLWVKNLRKLIDYDHNYYKPSSLGIAYRDLRAYGISVDSDYRATISNVILKLSLVVYDFLKMTDSNKNFDILKSMDAIMKPGELTVVLGRPGSGCSTLLKTISSHTYGFNLGEESKISYDGLTPKDIENNYRGDVIYSAETDIHFPQLTVADTLEFAARLRTPQNRGNVDRETYAKHMASVYMATYGLSHTRNSKVGNDFVRGVSGGERKRVSIAEASLSGANIQCWDNATRGLDAATALEFIKALKTSATVLNATPLIAIYQCLQDAYDLFDNVIVLYEGYQIFFGKTEKAKDFFFNMGYECPSRQTTADFLTSLTNPPERVVRSGYESLVPRNPKEFEAYWKNSPDYLSLVAEIDKYINSEETKQQKGSYHESHVARQSDHISPRSPYIVSFMMQTKYIIGRNILRMKGDPSISIFNIFGQLFMGLVLASVFYNLDLSVDSFYYRGAAIFFSVLFNAFSTLLEVMSLFEARTIVEKHKKYALYRPSADACASIITDLPVKLFMSMSFNFPMYFMVNLRRAPGRFFYYWLMTFLCMLVMSHLYRCLGAIATSLAGAMIPATILLIGMVIFTGFVIPTPYMLGWSRWINYINPIGYIFEGLMANEFADRVFNCTSFVPSGPDYQAVEPNQQICSAVGARAGINYVNGSDYIAIAYSYYNSHKWRNFGIAVAFIVFFLGVYILLTEFNKGAMQKGEIVLFLRSTLRRRKKESRKCKPGNNDIENGIIDEVINHKDEIDAINSTASPGILKHDDAPAADIFFWKDLTYQVQIKSEERVILDHVDGWVKPGQLTALMGSSGAGKTTLLNCLSERVTTGIISDGVRMVNGHLLDSSFQRSIGYVQQQDLHLPTSTVREALKFSAYLRQPDSTSKKGKNEYVEYIINLLEMNTYADALVGVAGEGLNVEQRKRLTIGVELVAKPKLLIFLDEPTSGLDSQTAWSICKLMRKLADNGQAILCTIHQPSAVLLKEFDRLLFLQKGGQTVYFGELGEGCSTLINYFEKYGSHPCPEGSNPVEWMLEVVGAAPGFRANQNYHEVWKGSHEYKVVRYEIETMEKELVTKPKELVAGEHTKYAAPIWKQYLIVTTRVFQQNWRSPAYIYGKFSMVIIVSLFNGFAFFKSDRSLQGLQNQMFSLFEFMIPLITLIQQMMPYFIEHRSLYEVREAPSKMYSWFTFIAAEVTSEIPIQIVVGTLAFLCWFYPVGLYQNAEITDSVDSRGILMWLFIICFFIYTSTLGQLCISFSEVPENAANLATTLFTLSLLFCGILSTPGAMPGFWIFMYRVSPMTYMTGGTLGTALANNKVTCSQSELLIFDAPAGKTCGDYMKKYISKAGGYLTNPSFSKGCEFCEMASTNDYLESINIHFNERWRDFGIFIAYIAINIIGTFVFYWLARVPKSNREKKK